MYEGAVQDLIDELGRLPGVGPKSAQRIAFHLLAADPADVRRLVTALTEVKDKVRFCSVCGNVSEEDMCRVCRDPRRDLAVICVVEEPKDVVAIERTREFRGRYHVLGGAISPIDGIGPDDLRIRELLTRLRDGVVTELILATDPNLEGEATATYLARLFKDMDLTVTRLASGLPVGGDQPPTARVAVVQHGNAWRLLAAAVPVQLYMNNASSRATLAGAAVPDGEVALFPGAVPIRFDTAELQVAHGAITFGAPTTVP